MPIKSTTFGGVELSGKDAARFIKHMHEDKPNPIVKSSLTMGRKIIASMPNKINSER